ncbi:hypothetical protein Tco_0610084 [Tanacetum coccineum]
MRSVRMALGEVVTDLPPSTPVDAENWISHIEKIFEVSRCADEFKARSGQQKYKREYHTIRQRDRETSGEFMMRFLRLTDGIVNTEFTDVAQVANAARNIKILRERSSQNTCETHEAERIRTVAQGKNQRGYNQKGYDGRSYDRQGGNSNQKSWQNRGQEYNHSSGSSGQKGYPDYASSPPCDTCGKLHPGKACHRVTGSCFT